MSNLNPVRSHPEGSMVTVWVVPGAKRTEIVGRYGDALRVRVSAPPEKGRANRALIDLFEDLFGAKVRLAGGAGSRRKRLIVVAVSPEALSARVDEIAN